MGINCVYSEENGDPSCDAFGTRDTKSPKITFDETKLTPGFDVNVVSSFLFPGKDEYQITPKVKAFDGIDFGVKTDEDARCSIGLGSPELPNLFFSSDFRQEHEMTIRFPDASHELALNQYKLLVTCRDRSGNQNQDVFIIRVDLDFTVRVVPEIVDTNPKPGTLDVNNEIIGLDLYVNRPFNDCRYSDVNVPYNDMNSFDCKKVVQEIRYDPFTPLGTFICNSTLKINSNKFFFNCKDRIGIVNPENYEFTIS